MTYTVSFNSNGGSNVDPQTIETGKKASQPTDPIKPEYTFENWYSEEALATPFDFDANAITQNITLYAKWTPITYTVTFNPNNGEAVTSQSVAYGRVVPKPENPTKADSTFAGWYKDQVLSQAFDFSADTITQDITLYAKWVPEGTTVAYTVRFNANGGTPNEEEKTVEAGKLLAKPATEPTKEGHTFAGWYNDQALSQAFDFDTEKITAGITLYAKWTPITYTVTFDPNNGEAVTSQSVTYGRVVPKPENPTKADSTFAGWYKDQVLSQAFDFSADNITQDITLYAQWVSEGTTVIYTVRFILNGGTPNVEDNTVEAGTLLDKPASEPTKEGYTFAGWFNDQALTQAFDFSADTITANTTLYAQWTPASYTVTFIPNNGKAVASLSLAYGSSVPNPRGFTKADSTFAGWYKDQALTQTFDFDTEKVTADITFYAKWIPKETAVTYTVTFNSNEGSKTDPQTIESGEKASRPTDPTKTYHTFLGWYNDEGLTQAFDFDANAITQDTTLYAQWESHLVTIPDANFKAKLKALIPYAFVGEQLYAKSPDVTGRKNLDVSSAGIEDLTGIEYFTALTELNCGDNRLTALDVSSLTALQRLVCGENALTQLDVAANTALDVLSCNQNALTRLDVSNNIKLVQLWCHKNQLTYLDIRGVRSTVQPLRIHEETNETNAIDTLKVHETLKQDDEVKEVKTARGDKVTIATYSAAAGSTAYTSVCGNYNPTTDACLLVEIPDAVFRAKLQALIPTAFVGELLNTGSTIVTGREELNVSNSGADSIRDLTGIEYFTGLKKLYCNDNSLTALEVSKNTALGWLEVNNNNLNSLDVSKNTGFIKLSVSNNSLTALKMTTNRFFGELYCENNRLTNLDLSMVTGINVLSCSNNRLTRLDLSQSTGLFSLKCHNNRLTYLDMRGVRGTFGASITIQAGTNETNVIDTLKVYVSLKNYAQISAVKTARGDKVKIETYSASGTSYTLVCSDYDPTETDEQDRCKDAP